MINRKILYISDSLSYVKSNCFQRQLYSALKFGFEVDELDLFPLQLFGLRRRLVNLDRYDHVLSVLKLRTLHQHWPLLKKWIGDAPLVIYDQDPWESYIDTAPTKGIYQVLLENFNLKRVYVTAPWWARKLRKDGLPAEFVRMGMNPDYCDPGEPFELRATNIGFRGALHEHRKIIFKRLEKVGINVERSGSRLNYDDYLTYLQGLKFFAHDESALPWVCDREAIPRSTAMWVKSVETAARGTFCLRDYHEEGEAYNLSGLPLIQCYKSVEDVPNIVQSIFDMEPSVRRALQVETVNQIRRQYDWLDTAYTLATGVNVFNET